jgi:thiol-disulfide isomerase/thioredoxin
VICGRDSKRFIPVTISILGIFEGYKKMRIGFTFFAVATVTVGLASVSVGKLASSDDSSSGDVVKLERLTWKQLQDRLVNNKVKFTVVDAWSTTCGPCKENFPHVVEMHRKYAKKGVAVISLSLDDPSDKAAVDEAEKFLKSRHALFTNVLLDETFGEGFEKLKIGAIPAVFVFGPDGKEVKRFTMDDPNNQFTYDEVEKAVVALLDGKQ